MRTNPARGLATAGVCILAGLALAGCAPRTSHQSPPTETPVAAPAPGSLGAGPALSANAVSAEGLVAGVSRPPSPGSVPYKDAIIAVDLTGVRAQRGRVPKEIVVYLWGMKDNQQTPAAGIQKGQRLSFTLRAWEDVEDQYGGYNRVELTDPRTMSLPAYWGEMVSLVK